MTHEKVKTNFFVLAEQCEQLCFLTDMSCPEVAVMVTNHSRFSQKRYVVYHESRSRSPVKIDLVNLKYIAAKIEFQG